MNPAKIGQLFGTLAKALQKRDEYLGDGLYARAVRENKRIASLLHKLSEDVLKTTETRLTLQRYQDCRF